MRIIDASFLKSATVRAEWPADGGIGEIALCGRSNVGKSSLLNSLLGRHGLARVSRTPGRTRLLNFFTVNFIGSAGARSEFLVTDLPGFGYAEVSKGERQRWQKMMDEYLAGRQSLRAVVLLFDSRRVLDKRAAELLSDEVEIAIYLESLGRMVIPVITKVDKLSKHERKPAAAALTRLIRRPALIYSSTTGEGKTELLGRIAAAISKKRPPANLPASNSADFAEVPHEGNSV